MAKLRWYLVTGQFVMPHSPFVLGSEPKIFTSIPVRARNPKDAIANVFSQMYHDWICITDVDGQRPEDISDDDVDKLSEERMNQLLLARKPIDQEEWTAKAISVTAARIIFERKLLEHVGM